MSSSASDTRGLTRRRRPSRRQPLRRCKRFRGDPRGGPFLMDIPEPVLRHILEFTMWDDEENKAKQCLALWKWTGQLGIVCRAFRRLARSVAPEKLIVDFNNFRFSTPVSFLRSFVEIPWKKGKLQEFECTFYSGEPVAGSLSTLERLFETPESFPNLTRLSLDLTIRDHPLHGLNAEFLFNVTRSCPILTDLTLNTGDDKYDTPTPEQLGNFGRLLRTPLTQCKLLGEWKTDEHLDAFLRQQGQGLVSFGATSGVSDSTLGIISTHCSQLEKLSLKRSDITDTGLSSLLQEIGGLTELDVFGCNNLTDEVIGVLNTHSPQLERIDVRYCPRWFTDACLDRLVQGQIDYWAGRSEGIPLCQVKVENTNVTRAGINRVLAKPNIGHLEIHWYDWDEEDDVVLTHA